MRSNPLLLCSLPSHDRRVDIMILPPSCICLYEVRGLCAPVAPVRARARLRFPRPHHPSCRCQAGCAGGRARSRPRQRRVHGRVPGRSFARGLKIIGRSFVLFLASIRNEAREYELIKGAVLQLRPCRLFLSCVPFGACNVHEYLRHEELAIEIDHIKECHTRTRLLEALKGRATE